MSPKTAAPILLDVLEPPIPGSELERVRQLLQAFAVAEEVKAGASLHAPLHVVLHGPEGSEVPLPANWERTVLRMLREALAGRHVEVRVETADEVGTEKLAELLGVSRPTAAALVDQAALPSRVTPGGHRRVRLADVGAYLRRRERQRASLAELVAHGEATGLPLETLAALRGVPTGDGEADEA